jgi:hypothetical protein
VMSEVNVEAAVASGMSEADARDTSSRTFRAVLAVAKAVATGCGTE